MRRLLLAVLLLALAAPVSAHGATVSVFVPYCAPEQSKYGACYPDEARFKAAAGEVNKLTIKRTNEAPSYVPHAVFSDQNAPVQAGSGCTQIDEHTADCTGYILVPVVDAGDGDDVVAGEGTFTGGDGNDTLSGASSQAGGPGDDKLTAGDTGSTLEGGPGHDTLTGGKGTDRLLDSGPAGEQDLVDGGEGTDTLDFTGRRTGVTVSLAQPGAEDQIANVENLRGGDGNDLLTGGGGPNQIEGGAGRDTVSGGDGDDVLDGGTGADSVNGGSGSDQLDGGVGDGHDTLACGDGADRAEPESRTVIGSDCERVGLDEFDSDGVPLLHLPLRSARGSVLTFEPLGCIYLPCRVKLTLTTTRGTLLGQTVATQRKRRPALPKRMTLRLSRAGRRALARAGTMRARVRIATREQGEVSATTFLVELTRPS